MFNTFWVRIKKSGLFFSVEKYYLDESRIVYCKKRLTFTRIGAKIVARRFVTKQISKQYIKEIT
jgi:hypothetical protein